MVINQFHSGSAAGDAITNQMLLIQDILRKEGYESEIYVEHIGEGLGNRLKKISSYKGQEDAILLVHHSMGFDCFEKIIGLPDKKVLIYHNITPERFFEDEGIKKYIRKGLAQLKEYRNHVVYSIADSNYNRKDMIRQGYDKVDVMPVQVSLNRFDNLEIVKEIKEKYQSSKNILFVGRVVPNKCQDDLIKCFSLYAKYFNANSRLFLAGDLGMEGYVAQLKELCREREVEDKVFFLGKVSERELKTYYELADIFLSMSEHEGFGVPLLEAMKAGVPVVAYSSSAIPETMGGAGVLLSQKNYTVTAGLIHELISDKGLYEKIKSKQFERIEKLKRTDTEQILKRIIKNIEAGNRKQEIQIQGPFETSYSLAQVNRRLAEALDDLGENSVSIYCTEGPGDYEPKKEDLKDKEHAKNLWLKSKQVTYPDVTIRNMYPPRVADANGAFNFGAFGWEEDIIPNEYIHNFNKYLSGIGTMSEFVTNTLLKSGLTIPVKTMGIGVDLPDNYADLEKYPLKTKKKIKFLHISSAFPRKGVDLLLKGYFEEFSVSDDVCLVIKTFPNPHNTVPEQLKQLRKQYPDGPEVELINEDLLAEKLYGLYKSADCYVQMARGEGFGLPVAEAMLAKVPVIVSNNTGMADFCNEENALLVDYEMVEAKSHLSAKGAHWAEPNVETLKKWMRAFVEKPESLNLDAKIEKAHALIANEYSWNAVALRWEQFIAEVQQYEHRPKVAMVSSWNTKCGIAEYTRLQCEQMKKYVDFRIFPNFGDRLIKSDESFVEPRVWQNAFEGNLYRLQEALLASDCDTVHIQFNFGFFDLVQLGKMLDVLTDAKRVIITFHKTKDSYVGKRKVSLRTIKDALNKCSALIVHQQEDIKILIEDGIDKNKIVLIPHGQIRYDNLPAKIMREELKVEGTPVLGSYGFLLPHKGIKENIEAISVLKREYPDILYLIVCALHEAPVSKEYYQECKKLVERLGLEKNVQFVTDYLENDESMKYLQCCDLCLMTYLPSEESASGAVRFCVAAQRPLITTKQEIFKEFEDCAYQVDKNRPELVADAVKKMLDSSFSHSYMEKMLEHVNQTSWDVVCKKINELYLPKEK